MLIPINQIGIEKRFFNFVSVYKNNFMLIVLTIFFSISAIVIISSIKNALPVDENLNPLKNKEKKGNKKTANQKTKAKSVFFGTHSRSIA